MSAADSEEDEENAFGSSVHTCEEDFVQLKARNNELKDASVQRQVLEYANALLKVPDIRANRPIEMFILDASVMDDNEVPNTMTHTQFREDSLGTRFDAYVGEHTKRQNSSYCVVVLHGVLSDGSTASCIAMGYHPTIRFLVKSQQFMNPGKIKQEVSRLTGVPDLMVRCRIEQVRESYGWHPDASNPRKVRTVPCAVVQVPTLRAYWKLANITSNAKPVQLEHIERKVDNTLRFFDDNSMKPNSWVSVDCWAVPPKRLTHARVEVSAQMRSVHTIECDAIPPCMQVGFDIETLRWARNKPNTFPQAKNPMDSVTQISFSFNRHASDEREERNVVFCLGATQPSKNPLTTYFSFQTEIGMLNSFRDLVVASGASLITGYNILKYDFPYLDERCRMLNSQRFWAFSMFLCQVGTLKARKLSSSALGHMETFSIADIRGVYVIDILEEVKRRYSLAEYTLKSVTKHFLQAGCQVQLLRRLEDSLSGKQTWEIKGPPGVDAREELNAYLLKHKLPVLYTPQRVREDDIRYILQPDGDSLIIVVVASVEGSLIFRGTPQRLQELCIDTCGDLELDSTPIYTEQGVLCITSVHHDGRPAQSYHWNDVECAHVKLQHFQCICFVFRDGVEECLHVNEDPAQVQARNDALNDALNDATSTVMFDDVVLPNHNMPHQEGDLACIESLDGNVILRPSLHKIELPYEELFEITRRALEGNGDMTVANEYADVDAQLPLRLMMRLHILTSLCEVARVTCCRIPEQLTRGQGIKLLSAIVWFLHRQQPPYVYIEPLASPEKDFEGATVLNPMQNFYVDPIITLDFASLYPSVMCTYNLCFSTLDITESAKHLNVPHETFDIQDGVADTFVKAEVVEGILPKLVREIMGSRKAAKKAMAAATDPLMKTVYNQRQLALKVLANSCYGGTGALQGYFTCFPVARSVCFNGRKLIHETKRMVLEHPAAKGCSIVYGDSVVQETPIMIRSHLTGQMRLTTFDVLGHELEWKRDSRGKEYAHLDADVWAAGGWQRLTRLIRHRVDKPLFLVHARGGLVATTADHSLLLTTGQKIKPEECTPRKTVLLTGWPQNLPPVCDDDHLCKNLQYARLLGAFFGCGHLEFGKRPTWTLKWGRGDLDLLHDYGLVAHEAHPRCTFSQYTMLMRGDDDPTNRPRWLVGSAVDTEAQHELVTEFRCSMYDAFGRKIVPNCVLAADPGVQDAFISGVADISGVYGECGTTLSFRLQDMITAQGMYVILRGSGREVSFDFDDGHFVLHSRRGVSHEPAGMVLTVTKLPPRHGEYVYDVSVDVSHAFGAGLGSLTVSNTDSVMVLVPGKSVQEAWDLGVILGEFITNKFPGIIELECEQIKCPGLFTKVKKVYSAVVWELDKQGRLRRLPELLAKGNEIARRDHPPFVRESLKRALTALMFEACKLDDPSLVKASAFLNSLSVCLETVRRDVRRLVRNEVPLKEFVLSKTLKPKSEYATPFHPHYQVALRMAEWPTNARVPFFYRQPTRHELTYLKISQLAESPDTVEERKVTPWTIKVLQAFRKSLFRPLGVFQDLSLAHKIFDTAETLIDQKLSQQTTLLQMMTGRRPKTVLDTPICSNVCDKASGSKESTMHAESQVPVEDDLTSLPVVTDSSAFAPLPPREKVSKKRSALGLRMPGKKR